MNKIEKKDLNMFKRKFFKKKNGGKEIIVELGLAVIGLALVVIFRTQVTTIITTIGTAISDKITAILAGF